MNIKRFFGKNSREALSMVRKELGENAIILSNRAINGGNEILAFREEDMNAALTYQAPKLGDSTRATSLLDHVNKNNMQDFDDESETLDIITEIHALKSKQQKIAKQEKIKRELASLQLPAEGSANQLVAVSAMLEEMREMRRSVESQLTTISWGKMSAGKSKMLNKLLNTGFSASISRRLIEKLPSNLNEAESLKWIKAILNKNLNTLGNEAEVLDQGGIFALIGPTGVGKTTTMAKLAARYVMKHGTQNLGLITTDAYRVGGYEQLRIYGKILGVMVHAVKDEDDLKIALNELKNKHTILIDTVGVSQRDQMVAKQISMLSSANSRIKRLLCLNATSTGETLTDVIRAYKGKGLDGCIITKLDEAATIGSALDTIIREKLKLFYIANGQRVPEDIHLANKLWLLDYVFKQRATRSKPFQFTAEELPFVMGNTVNSGAMPRYAEINYA